MNNREKCNWPFFGPRMPQGDKNWDAPGFKIRNSRKFSEIADAGCFIKIFLFSIVSSLWNKLHRSGNPAVLAHGDETAFISIAEKTTLYVWNDSNFNRKNKEPLELLEKIGSRYEKFLKEFLSDRPNLTKSVNKQLSSLWERMEGMYTKLNPKCKFYEISDSNDTTERWNSY